VQRRAPGAFAYGFDDGAKTAASEPQNLPVRQIAAQAVVVGGTAAPSRRDAADAVTGGDIQQSTGELKVPGHVVRPR
jgi:hypothetical protein